MMKKIGKMILSIILAAVICVGQVSAAETAAKIRLEKTEGIVGVSNSAGRSLSSRKDMLLYNGYHVKTEEESYAWVSLDDDKIDKLDASSEIGIRKSNKKLEILLNEGNLYFNVAKPLEEDESLNIRTSTMIVGIRGTCGWVRVIDQWSTEVSVLEGTVQCTVTDPVSGQSKTTTVTGGSRAVFTVYAPERQGDKCDILRDTFTEGDIPGFVLVELIQDKPLCEKIYQDSGLDLRNITPEEAGARLSEGQAENAQKQAVRKKLAEEQERHIAVDPVWEDTPPSSDGGGTSSSSTPPAAEPKTTTMPLTAAQVQALLNANSAVSVQPSATPAENTLTVDTDLTVAAGRTLTLGDGIDVAVNAGNALSVDGTLNMSGNLTNNGTVNVSSGDTLRAKGDFSGDGTVEVTAAGKLVADGTFNKPATFLLTRGARVLARSFGFTDFPEGWTKSGPDGDGYYSLVYTTHTVTFDSGGGSAVAPATVAQGGKAPEPAAPTRTGYTFDGWFKDAACTTAWDFDADTVDGPMTLYAKWVALYKVTFDPNGGTLADGEATADTNAGGTVALPAVDPVNTNISPNKGLAYTFAGWYDSAIGGEKITSSTVFTEDTTVYAHWTVSELDWELRDDNATLRIFGSGAISDYSSTDLPPWGNDETITNVVIEDGITGIGAYAFYHCGNLTSVAIPSSVTSIGKWAFTRCENLTSIVIPEGVSSIGEYTFHSCRSLTGIAIPDSVTSIGQFAFTDCPGLADITIPDSVTSIGNHAFYECTGLTGVTIGRGVTSIGISVFYGCSGLTDITIPDSVTSIGTCAFEGCSGLTGVAISPSVTSIGIRAFQNCSGLPDVTIPSGVTSIDDSSFKGCSSLTSVTIPSSVTRIFNEAFQGCSGLTDVYYSGTQEQWDMINVGSDNEELTGATIHYNSTGPEIGTDAGA